MTLPEQPANALQQLRTIEVTLNSQQLLWLLEEFGEEVNPAEGLVRLVNRTMAAQYRSRMRKATDGVKLVQMPAPSVSESPPVPASSPAPVLASHSPERSKAQESPSVSPPTALSPIAVPPDWDQGNPIGVLQEHCQKQRLPLPDYQFSPTAQGFQCEVSALGQRAIAVGSSKQSAKHQAARQLLGKLNGRSDVV